MRTLDGRKWCHALWRTHRHRKFLKIAATARFCERVIRDAGAACGWTVDAVSVTDDGVRVLLQVPAAVHRDAVVERLQRATAGALLAAGVLPAWTRRVWDPRHWCAVLTNAAAVAAVRRHIAARGLPSASARGAPP